MRVIQKNNMPVLSDGPRDPTMHESYRRTPRFAAEAEN